MDLRQQQCQAKQRFLTTCIPPSFKVGLSGRRVAHECTAQEQLSGLRPKAREILASRASEACRQKFCQLGK